MPVQWLENVGQALELLFWEGHLCVCVCVGGGAMNPNVHEFLAATR